METSQLESLIRANENEFVELIDRNNEIMRDRVNGFEELIKINDNLLEINCNEHARLIAIRELTSMSAAAIVEVS